MITYENLHRVTVKVNRGSGLLIMLNEKSFVLTAQHCLLDEGNSLERDDGTILKDTGKIYAHKKNDIALIELHSVESGLLVKGTTDVSLKDKVRVYGYPYSLDRKNLEPITGLPIDGEVQIVHSGLYIQTELSHDGSNINNIKTIENLRGLSGSGVFKVANGELFLIGILLKLQKDEHSHQLIRCQTLETVLEFIDECELGSFKTENINRVRVQNKFNVNKNYLKADIFHGGTTHFQNNFTYTYENKEYFLVRGIKDDILFRLKSKLNKSIILLNGEAGYGKTTLIRQCISELLEDNNIYINNDENIDDFIKMLEDLELNDIKVNTIVIVDRFPFFKNKKILNKLFNMVSKENMFHLIISPYRSTNDNNEEDINTKFKKYMKSISFNDFEIFSVSNYTKDKSTFITKYKENFPDGVNENTLHTLIKTNKPLAFISAIIFNNDNLENPIIELLENSNINEMDYSFIEILITIYFFTSKGESLKYKETYSKDLEIIKYLNDNQLITFFSENIGGISDFYDDYISNIILKEYFDNDREQMFQKIIETVIHSFKTLSPLFLFFDKHKIEYEDSYYSLVFRHLDIILKKINIFDLFDVRDMINENEKKLDTRDIKTLLFKVLEQYYTMRIDGRKSLKKFEMFYVEIKKDFDYFGWKYDYPELDFSEEKYFLDSEKANINKLIEDYSSNYNIVAYIISYITKIDYGGITDKTNTEILLLLKSDYEKLDSLIYIENKIFTKLLAIYSYSQSPMSLMGIFDFKMIFEHILKEDTYDSYSFKFLTNILDTKLNCMEKSFFNIDYFLEHKLQGDYVIFELLIKKDWLSNDDIQKIIIYLSQYPNNTTYATTYKIFSLYENKKEFLINSEAMVILLRQASNRTYNDILQDRQGYYNIKYFLEYKENIIKYINEKKEFGLAQKYINMFLLLDNSKNIKYTTEYMALIKTSSKDMFVMLYMEYKNYILKKTIKEYKKYCKKQRKKGHRLTNFSNEKEYIKAQNRGMKLYSILSKFYFENPNLDYANHVVANILKQLDSNMYKDEIIELFRKDIDSYISDFNNLGIYTYDEREKSIVDLVNFYGDDLCMCEEVKNLLKNNIRYIKYEKHKEYMEKAFKKCEESKELKDENIGKSNLKLLTNEDDLNKIEKSDEKVELLVVNENQPSINKKIYIGIVTNITSYGMFVDIGGKDGLVHYSEISHKGSVNPSKFYKIGDEVKVMVIGYDKKKRHISLSIKKAIVDPWQDIDTRLIRGDTLPVTVLNIEPYGAFVDFGEDLEGFLHVSEISWKENVKHPKEYIEIGQKFDVKIMEIDKENRKLRVSRKRLLPKPIEEFASTNQVGDVITGIVTSVTDFGVFLNIGAIEGLLHNTELSWEKLELARELYKPGDKVKVKIIKINIEEKKVALSKKALEKSPILEIVEDTVNKEKVNTFDITKNNSQLNSVKENSNDLQLENNSFKNPTLNIDKKSFSIKDIKNLEKEAIEIKDKNFKEYVLKKQNIISIKMKRFSDKPKEWLHDITKLLSETRESNNKNLLDIAIDEAEKSISIFKYSLKDGKITDLKYLYFLNALALAYYKDEKLKKASVKNKEALDILAKKSNLEDSDINEIAIDLKKKIENENSNDLLLENNNFENSHLNNIEKKANEVKDENDKKHIDKTQIYENSKKSIIVEESTSQDKEEKKSKFVEQELVTLMSETSKKKSNKTLLLVSLSTLLFVGIGTFCFVNDMCQKEEHNFISSKEKIVQHLSEEKKNKPMVDNEKLSTKKAFKKAIKLYENNFIEAAEEYFKIAANLGHTKSKFYLGQIAEDSKNYKDAKKYYYEASKEGDLEGEFFYAEMMRDENNLEEAKIWYEKSAKQGHLIAKFMLGEIAFDDEQYSDAQQYYEEILNSKELEIDNSIQTANIMIKTNHDRLKCNLCFIYFQIDKDNEKAKKIVPLDTPTGQSYYGTILLRENKRKEAEKWLKKAAKNGDESSRELLKKYF